MFAAAERKVDAARMEARLAREREKVSVALERRRASEARADAQETVRAHGARSSALRYGLIGGGAAGVGLALLAAQFVTLGAVALALAGGGVLGWRMRRGSGARMVDVTPAKTIDGAPKKARFGIGRATSGAG
jgi:hypothetical protein